MSRFVVIFMPETVKSGNVGEVISILESLDLRVVESYRFHIKSEILEKMDEYLRITNCWHRSYYNEEFSRRCRELKLLASEGNLFALKFDSQIVHSLENLRFMMSSQTKLHPCSWMIFKEDQLD